MNGASSAEIHAVVGSRAGLLLLAQATLSSVNFLLVLLCMRLHLLDRSRANTGRDSAPRAAREPLHGVEEPLMLLLGPDAACDRRRDRARGEVQRRHGDSQSRQVVHDGVYLRSNEQISEWQTSIEHMFLASWLRASSLLLRYTGPSPSGPPLQPFLYSPACKPLAHTRPRAAGKRVRKESANLENIDQARHRVLQAFVLTTLRPKSPSRTDADPLHRPTQGPLLPTARRLHFECKQPSFTPRSHSCADYRILVRRCALAKRNQLLL